MLSRAAAVPETGSLRPLLFVALALASVACRDPVTEDAIGESRIGHDASLAGNQPPRHARRPCVLCHGVGGEPPQMAFAGTVYVDQATRTPLANAEVLVVDAAGRERSVRSNCAGNFYFEPAAGWPRFPAWTSVVAGQLRIDMESPIYREGSCAACHLRRVARPGQVAGGGIGKADLEAFVHRNDGVIQKIQDA